MSTFATLAVNNYAAAAVNYTTIRANGDIAVWADKSQGTISGYRVIEATVKRPKLASGVTRVKISVARPIVNGTTALVDYTGRAICEFLLPAAITLAERQELIAAMANALDNTVQVRPMVIDYDMPV